ncbi:hypothetical protein [Dyadobacter sp. 676]|uniref:Uncharacterized protein n=1 Tax=Dyadobacter sp. 676 TaxID=3088362 RepID=A0AAU8FJK9_9BACT
MNKPTPVPADEPLLGDLWYRRPPLTDTSYVTVYLICALRNNLLRKLKINTRLDNSSDIAGALTGTYTYNPKPVDGIPCVFQEKMYFMPIPQREIEKKQNLKQNSGR